MNPEQTAKAFDMLFEAMKPTNTVKEIEIPLIEKEPEDV